MQLPDFCIFALRITNDNSQYDGGDGRIEPVAFLEEINKREEDAQNRRQDESDDAQLNPTAGIHSAETCKDTAKRGVFRRMGLGVRKVSIVGHRVSAMAHQINDAAHRSNDASNAHANAQGMTNEKLNFHEMIERLQGLRDLVF